MAGYLNDLVDLGVAGIRIDAAKHMWPEVKPPIFKQRLSKVDRNQYLLIGYQSDVVPRERLAYLTRFPDWIEIVRLQRGN